ncbi:MAG: hypothetical protein ACYTEQ_21100 [Planctomycetota bacterium]|jgi:hypothetical protein
MEGKEMRNPFADLTQVETIMALAGIVLAIANYYLILCYARFGNRMFYVAKKPIEIKIGDKVRYKTPHTEKTFVGEIMSKGAGNSVCIKWETGLTSHHWSGFLVTKYDDGYIKMFYHSLDGEYPR